MYLFRSLVFNCKRATLLSIKKAEGNITLLERAQLAYHLLYCDPCRQFIRQSAQIDKALSDASHSLHAKPPFALPSAARQRIQQQLDGSAPAAE
ncbi:MAG: hypothetical protein K1X47_16805 [Cyclobacteriaceae bacterium]|nr:hypothetical protein [Cyclobacteriaceae bacterium]